MKLPRLKDIDIAGKKILIRADLDVGDVIDKRERRLEILINLLEKLTEKPAKITIIGHRGQPNGEKTEKYSLKKVENFVKNHLEEKIGPGKLKKMNLKFLENLRFDKGEVENSRSFAESLAKGHDLYINEAFAVSHREHSSVIHIPELIPHVAGPHFVKEVEMLSKVFKDPQKPIVFVLSGKKSDKLNVIEDLEKIANKILIGGRLPESIHDQSPLRKKTRYIVANLIADKEDISISSIEKFEKEIEKAGTVVLSGPLGKFEEDSHLLGTKRVFEAVAQSSAYKVAGGGETEQAILKLGLEKRFDWVSIGGGAMVEFIAKGTLPGIEALLH